MTTKGAAPVSKPPAKPRWKEGAPYCHESRVGVVQWWGSCGRTGADLWKFETTAVGGSMLSVSGVERSFESAKAACERWAGIVAREAGK